MTEPSDQAEELRKKAKDLPYGPSKVALLEEAVQLVDSVNDIDLGFAIRHELMAAATFSGRPDIMLVAFSWCRAEYDRNPNRFESNRILWNYKWVIGAAKNFPEISRLRLEELLIDMERRYREAGSTMHGFLSMRRNAMGQLFDRQQARAAHADLRKCRRDWLSDCPACHAYGNLLYYRFQRQWTRAVQTVQPVLTGSLKCAEEPHRTFSGVLLPLVHLGRLEEAKIYQRQGYQLVGGASHFVRQHAEHLQFLVIIGEMTQANRLLVRHLPDALKTQPVDARFKFLLAARLWTDRLIDSGIHRLKVRVPTGMPAPAADGKSDVRELGNWFTEQAEQIAHRFDLRNGNDEHRRQLNELPKLLRLVAS